MSKERADVDMPGGVFVDGGQQAVAARSPPADYGGKSDD